MSNVSQIETPDGATYDLVAKIGRGLVRATMNNTASSATSFVVSADGISSLYDGLTIIVTNTKAASKSGVKLNLNGLGAKTIWISNSNAALTTQWAKNATYILVFDYTNDRWIWQTGHNTNTDTTTISVIFDGICYTKAGANGIKKTSLVMLDSDGKLQSLTTTSGTGTDKVKNTTGFVFPNIFYINIGSDVAADTVPTGSCYVYEQFNVDMRCSTNCGSTLVAGKFLYLVGTVGTDGLFYLDDTWWTQDLPTTEDGKVYIFVGNVISTTNCHLSALHPSYIFRNGGMQLYSSDTKTVNGILYQDANKYIDEVAARDSDNNGDYLPMVDPCCDEVKFKRQFPDEIINDVITFNSLNGGPVEKLQVDTGYGISSVDFKGYEKQWYGGSGNNLLFTPTGSGSISVYPTSQSSNLSFIISDIGEVTINGSVDECTKIYFNWSSQAPVFKWDGTSDYWLSGCPSGGSKTDGYSLYVFAEFRTDHNSFSEYDTGNGIRLQNGDLDPSGETRTSIVNGNLYFVVQLQPGTYENLVFKPMLNAGLSAMPYEPYSNICEVTPTISRDNISLKIYGENIFKCVGNLQFEQGSLIENPTVGSSYEDMKGYLSSKQCRSSSLYEIPVGSNNHIFFSYNNDENLRPYGGSFIIFGFDKDEKFLKKLNDGDWSENVISLYNEPDIKYIAIEVDRYDEEGEPDNITVSNCDGIISVTIGDDFMNLSEDYKGGRWKYKEPKIIDRKISLLPGSDSGFGFVYDFNSNKIFNKCIEFNFSSLTRTNDHEFYYSLSYFQMSELKNKYGDDIFCDRIVSATEPIVSGTAIDAIHTNDTGTKLIIHTKQAFSTAADCLKSLRNQKSSGDIQVVIKYTNPVEASSSYNRKWTTPPISILKGYNTILSDTIGDTIIFKAPMVTSSYEYIPDLIKNLKTYEITFRFDMANDRFISDDMFTIFNTYPGCLFYINTSTNDIYNYISGVSDNEIYIALNPAGSQWWAPSICFYKYEINPPANNYDDSAVPITTTELIYNPTNKHFTVYTIQTLPPATADDAGKIVTVNSSGNYVLTDPT